MRRSVVSLLTVVALIAGLALGGGPAASAAEAKNREFEGRVAKVNRANKTFVLRYAGGNRTVRIKANRRTRYDDMRNFRSIRRGMKLEVEARHNGKRWIAREIERED